MLLDRLCAYHALEKDYSAIVLITIGTVCACVARAGCWVRACGLQCLVPVHATHDAGIPLGRGTD